MKEKIVFYTMAMNKGGSERVISNLVNYLAKNDYDVYLICNLLCKSYYELDKKVKYITLDKKTIKYRFEAILKKIGCMRTKELKYQLEKINPDLVVAFLPEPSLRITYLNKYKTVLSERGDPNKEYSNFILKLIMKKYFKNAQGFIFQTDEAKAYFKDIVNCKTKIIPNPINNCFLNKKYVGINNSIVNVGRLSTQKNQKLLIKAFSIFFKTHPEYYLKIYGSGPMKNELINTAQKLNISDNVSFMGNVDNLQDELIKDRIFVLSSNYEGMPNALMEAMALGLPCIATDCPVGGPKMLIRNYENGILVPIDNEQTLANAMTEIADSSDLQKKLSCNAYQIQNDYNEEIIIGKWLSFFHSIIKSE